MMKKDERATGSGIQGHDVWPPLPVLGQARPSDPRNRDLPTKGWAGLFAVHYGQVSSKEVWQWWQARRWTYNKLVFGLGVPSFVLYMFFLKTSGQVGRIEMQDLIEPASLPIVVNICYTFGPIAEVILRYVSGIETRGIGLFLMRAGVGISLFVVFSPTLTAGAVWFWNVIVLHQGLHIN